jgi:hypothetical protein
LLSFYTRYGALNPYAMYYGLVSIGLGLVWFVALTACELLYKVTGGRLDPKRRIPVFLSHVWGTLLMLFTGCFPRVENGNIVRDFHERREKNARLAFVASHSPPPPRRGAKVLLYIRGIAYRRGSISIPPCSRNLTVLQNRIIRSRAQFSHSAIVPPLI